jgi:thiol-disulfide isomerase/thioredoxin
MDQSDGETNSGNNAPLNAGGRPLGTSPEPESAPRKPTPVSTWIIIGVVVIGALVYISKTRRDREAHAAIGGGTLIAAQTVVGRPAPDFSLPTIDGKTIRLSDFKGRPVIVDFWASWCGPCKMEIPSLDKVAQQYAGQGLTVVGISEDDSPKDVRSFLASGSVAMDYPVVMDENRLESTWGVPFGLPTTFFIRRDGTVADRVMGFEDYSEIERHVKDLF